MSPTTHPATEPPLTPWLCVCCYCCLPCLQPNNKGLALERAAALARARSQQAVSGNQERPQQQQEQQGNAELEQVGPTGSSRYTCGSQQLGGQASTMG